MNEARIYKLTEEDYRLDEEGEKWVEELNKEGQKRPNVIDPEVTDESVAKFNREIEDRYIDGKL